MYIPRGKLLALITIVVAASLVTATGAFTTVDTERTAEVSVAGDANAYLGLHANGANSHFAQAGDAGRLTIRFNEETATQQGGQGVNPGSIASFDEVFTITNQGAQRVQVTVGSSGAAIIPYNSENSNAITGMWIEPGETIRVGIRIDASDRAAGSDFSETITIHAESEGTADSGDSGNSSDSNTSTGAE